uniref:RRM domain-containing protein n=1 Tax=Clastoptera arizonana TaxID=38151 RepID=A0A1B6DA95_9HEMI
MSRLVIKNLPTSVTADKLREKFSSKGVVTDFQLKYTKSGKFRHFGFVGYQTAEQADAALNYFNNTFIGSSKITVEHCAELGDGKKPKSWSKYAKDSSAYQAIHKEDKEVINELPDIKDVKKSKKKEQVNSSILEKIKKHKDDPMFVEFMEAHAKDSRSIWGNDVSTIQDDNDSGVEDSKSGNEEEIMEKKIMNEKDLKESIAHSQISDMEYLKMKTKKSKIKKEVTKEEFTDDKIPKQEIIKSEENIKEKVKLHMVKIRNLPYKVKKRDLKELFRPLTTATIRIPPKVKGIAYVGFKTDKEMKKALIKNKSFISGKQISVSFYTNKEEVNDSIGSRQERWREQEEALNKDESIAESGSIFVRNLSYTVTEEELRSLFSKYGPLTEVNVPVDRITRKMKGFATITFLLPENAVQAFSSLDGTVLNGRMLHLLPAKSKETKEEEDEEGTNYKSKKLKQKKDEAGFSYNWNTLFVDKNAVAELVAETYNASKEEVLTGKDVAVRMALGETQIVAQTKQFLLDNGVNLNIFNQAPKQRSKTVILVKNLPANTTASEIRELFFKFGELGRILLPPSGVTAIVEFLEPSEARSAFTKLAYTKFKYMPLYLEWAPEDTFSASFTKGKSVKGEVNDQNKLEKTESEDEAEEGDDIKKKVKDEEKEESEEEIEPEADTTLFIKNINFDTDEDSIRKHFSKCGRIANVTVARKKDMKKPGELLSMGYGFIQFYTQKQVNQALKSLQNSSLDGHNIELKRSNRTLQTNNINSRKKSNVEKQTGTKIIARNIPFQATHNEVKQLFQTFGEIKAIRLPKKMVGTGSHRGFAFVEYYSKKEAKRAMQALCQSTHFFGRRLVLEWAQADETVEEIRKRTAQNFKADSAPKSKKSKADLQIEDDSDE